MPHLSPIGSAAPRLWPHLRVVAFGLICTLPASTFGQAPAATPKPKPTPQATKRKPQTSAQPSAVTRATEQQWEEAVNAFRYQDFDQAVTRLRKLLYPKPRLDEARSWRAREYLGASLWWNRKRDAANDEFTALLVRNPAARLDPAYYPPQMLKDLENLRANLVRLGVIKRGVKRRPRPLTPPVQAPPPLALSFFPLGVGQFANEQPLKGGLFLGAQVALGIASSALYLYNRDLAQAGQRSTAGAAAQLTTGGLFWGVALWGVVDALSHRSQNSASKPRAP